MVWHVLINSIASSVCIPNPVRSVIYRTLGLNIKTNGVMPGTFFMWKSIEIGQNTFVNRKCFFDVITKIGKNCDVGYEVMFCSSTHDIGSKERRAGDSKGQPINIEDGCWIGARAVILSGVTVKKGTIIAAGSIVTKDCESNSLYAGVPARKIKQLR